LLDSRWELSPESKLGTFNLRGYKPMYAMPLFATSNQNNEPHSPNPANTVQTPQQLQNVEGKFQLSLKTKIWQGVFGDAGDLWVGYTQSSRWQVYNAQASRPFRETDYEPEALLVFDTHYQVLGWDGRLFGIGVDHQSNGRGDPLSRSWNRVIADFGFERPGWTIMFRPWWRIPEARSDDDNPDISNYMGRADVQIIHEWHGQEFGMMLRHSLRGGSESHGAARFTWSFPIAGNLRGYMELFKGYGESLIDYNHNATYFGVGVSLLDWY
jgi:phospholipase A1